MPLYEYQCEACGRRFEVIQKFSDPPVEACTSCGKGPVVRLFSSPAIQFKGTGWYVTDYARKGQSDSTSSGNKDGAGSGAAAKTDGKSDTGGKADAASTSDTPAAAKSAPKTGAG